MLVAYRRQGNCIAPATWSEGGDLPPDMAWVDLFDPTPEEDRLVERALGIEIPTREEMQEIEASSRLYSESGAAFMTASVISGMDTDAPKIGPMTFVLAGGVLVTVRYAEPLPFAMFKQRAQRAAAGYTSGPLLMAGLVEALVDRMADVLERIGGDIDALSREIFAADRRKMRGDDFQSVLQRLGFKGDLTSKVRESLVSVARLSHYAIETIDAELHAGKAMEQRFKAIDRDVSSLLDHTNYLSSKINFLLDATLGLINIEQNRIIKLFSVVSVALMPPTLIASIYGMNFEAMPELKWAFGYPFAILAMIVSAAVPLWYFRSKNWL